MSVQKEALPPVKYRYIAADLLTDEVIAEIPLTGVSFQRAVKTPGVLDATFSTVAHKTVGDAYVDLTSGNTALYVLRKEGDGPEQCVWGGVVWGRQYSPKTKQMTIRGQDFLSLLYKRKIWKDWNNSFTAVVDFKGSESRITLIEPDEDEDPSIQKKSGFTDVRPGSSVHIEFPPASPVRRYGGYYQVSPTAAPSRTEIDLASAYTHSSIVAYEYDPSGDAALLYTDGPHNLNTGDIVEIHGVREFAGRREVISTGGSGRYDEFSVAHTDDAALSARGVTGAEVRREAPVGVFGDAIISLHTDTYDYVRALLLHGAKDFSSLTPGEGSILPGIESTMEVISYSRSLDILEIRTRTPHLLSAGRSVTLRGLSAEFDGQHPVHSVVDDHTFRIEKKGPDIPGITVTPKKARVTKMRVRDDSVTFVTDGAHNLRVGDWVNVSAGLGLPESQDVLTGEFRVSRILSTFEFVVDIEEDLVDERVDIPFLPSPQISGIEAVSVAYHDGLTEIYLADSPPEGLEVGETVSYQDIYRLVRIAQKSFSTKDGTAQVVTAQDHGLGTGDTVQIYGLKADMRVADTVIEGTKVTIKTQYAHPFRTGQSVELLDFEHSAAILQRGISGTTATLDVAGAGNLAVGDVITVRNLIDRPPMTGISIRGGAVRVNFSQDHNIGIGDEVTIKKAVSIESVISVMVIDNDVILTLTGTHNFSVGDQITVADVSDTFNGEHTVQRIGTRTVQYHLDRRKKDVPDIEYLPPTSLGGHVLAPETPVNGSHIVTAIPSARSIEFRLDARDEATFDLGDATLEASSVLNGEWTIGSKPLPTRIHFTVPAGIRPLPLGPAPQPPVPEDGTAGPEGPSVSAPAAYGGVRVVQSTTANSIVITSPRSLSNESFDRSRWGARVASDSFFNGTHTITVTSTRSFTFPKTGPVDLLETRSGDRAFLLHKELADGSKEVVAIDRVANSITIDGDSNSWTAPFSLPRRALVSSAPSVLSSTYGPFPANADWKFEFSTWSPSGRNTFPLIAQASQVVTIGDLLDQYTDSIDGFEYRIDCIYDPETDSFTRRFVFIEPKPSQSDIEWEQRDRKFVFEYPGNITDVNFSETAETSATRMFLLGRDGYGEDVGRRVVAAVDQSRLVGDGIFRPWPLLDDDETIPAVTDDQSLYAYARRYVNESRPPDPVIRISINGRMDPQVGTYQPGDWCDVVIDDEFIERALHAGRDQRGDVVTRKIDNFTVTIPDSGAVPEQVTINLVTEWEDSVDQQP